MKIGRSLHSLQFIAPNGEKRFLPGGARSGVVITQSALLTA